MQSQAAESIYGLLCPIPVAHPRSGIKQDHLLPLSMKAFLPQSLLIIWDCQLGTIPDVNIMMEMTVTVILIYLRYTFRGETALLVAALQLVGCNSLDAHVRYCSSFQLTYMSRETKSKNTANNFASMVSFGM